MHTRKYVTNAPRVGVSLAAGAITGAILILLWYFWNAVQIHGIQYAFSYGLITAIYVFMAAFGIWAIGLTLLGIPLWWLLHRFRLRHWLIAAVVGAALTFLAQFALETRIFELIPPPANSTYSAGDADGPTVIANRLTPHGWWVAFRTALTLSVAGVVVALVVWRIAYRRVDGQPS